MERIFSQRGLPRYTSATLRLYDTGDATFDMYETGLAGEDQTRYDGQYTEDGQSIRLRFELDDGHGLDVEGELIERTLTIPGKSVFAGRYEQR